MTSPGQYAAQDGSFARSAGGAAGRGIILIVIAVAVGLVLLAKGFDGGDTSLAKPTTAGDAAEDTSTEGGADDSTEGDADGSTEGGADGSTEGGDGDPAGPTADTPAESGATRPPGEVKVAAVNTTGEPGLAGTATGILDTQGYVTAAKNGILSEVSTVFYVAGYSEDAKAVASILGIPADRILPTELADVLSLVTNNDNVADFHVFVIQGTDRLAG